MFDVFVLPRARTTFLALLPGLTAEERQTVLIRLTHLHDLLRHQPERVGESAAGTVRRLLLDTLGVEYEVDPDFPVVRIRRFWLTRPSA